MHLAHPGTTTHHINVAGDLFPHVRQGMRHFSMMSDYSIKLARRARAALELSVRPDPCCRMSRPILRTLVPLPSRALEAVTIRYLFEAGRTDADPIPYMLTRD